MSNTQDTIRLLVINDSQAEVERLLSMLRNAGKSTRPQHVPSREGLEKLLTEQAWDLLIGLDNSKNCNIKEAIRSIRKLDKDVPVIIQADIADESERTVALIDGLKAGARDVVVLDDDQHLLLVIDRELQNLDERRERRVIDRKLNTLERRCQQLLDSSRDAIAYIEDGMFLYLNRSFAEMFGYSDPDDLLVLPFIDIVAEKDQNTFVQFMKNFKMTDATQALSVKVINTAGQEFDITLQASHASHEEQACVQLLVEGVGAIVFPAAVAASATSPATSISAGASPSPASPPSPAKQAGIDPVTGLLDRKQMMALLDNAVQEAAEKNRYRSLHYLSIDRFEQHQRNLGSDTDAMLASLANCLKAGLDKDVVLAHINNEEFLLLSPGIDSDQHLNAATALCRKVEAYICSAGAKSVQVTVSIGIAPISENATNPEEILKRARQAADEVRAEGKDGVGNRAKVYTPKISGGDADTAAILEVVRHALGKDSFQILFQPLISLHGEPEEHYEVFVRIADGAGKPLDTAKMFRAVENDHDLAIKLDRALILKATKMLALHRANGHDTRLLFNLTRVSLLDTTLVPWLSVAFKAANIPAAAAIFQISEENATNYLAQVKTFTDALHTIGSPSAIKRFGCSLDPFRTLSHLTNVSMVKVDGSFSTDIQKKSEDPKALKELVRKLTQAGKKTIIPFVENATMMAILWQTGAHFIEGHYLQAPSPNMNFQFSEE